jgi:hypothetical protein
VDFEPNLGGPDETSLLAQRQSITRQNAYITIIHPKICLTSVFVGNLARILTMLPTILVRWYFSQANVRNSTLKLPKNCLIPLFLLPDLSISVNFNTSRSRDALNTCIGERLEIFRVLLRISQSASFGYELLDL